VIRVNGKEQAYVDESVDALIQRLSIEPRGIAVAIDGEIVRRSAWLSTLITDDCAVEIVTAAAGG
jgi:sulfur carrier protein